MEPIVRCYIVDDTEKKRLETEEKIKQKRLEIKERDLKHKQELEEMEKRVYNRPLLMNQNNDKRARKMMQIKHLKLIRDTAIKSGVKDIKALFNNEERDLLEEADLIYNNY